MSSITTDNLNFSLLKSLENRILTEDVILYFFYARSIGWSGNDPVPNPSSSLNEINSIKSNILSMKRVRASDIALGFTKRRWASSRVYDEYSDRAELSDLEFFVINSENNVYKCISNNSGAVSTEEPVGQTVFSLISTTDGYLWKYMFNIPESFLRKFSLDSFLPFSKDQTVIDGAVDGSIEKITIDQSGSGYGDPGTATEPVAVFVNGNGKVNDSATIRIQNLFSQNGDIRTVEILNNGENYRIPVNSENSRVPVAIRQIEADVESVTEAAESETAYGLATVNQSGGIENVEIIRPGSNYKKGEAKIVESSATAYAQVSVFNGSITRVDVQYKGEDFTRASTVLVTNRGTGAELTPVISPTGGHGSDPERELLASALLFNIRIAYDEGADFTTENDIRTLGLIENPRRNSDGSFATERTLTGKTTLTLTNESANLFSADEVIIGDISGARATVVDSPDERTLRVIRDDQNSNDVDFQLNETIRSETGQTDVLESITDGTYQPYSGNILFINNRQPIIRSENQIESINLSLNF